jgi:hypothetical protein
MSKPPNFIKPEQSESKFAMFSHKSSKFLSGILDSKDTCKVCGCSFKLLTTNKCFCSSCSQAVCKDHSSETIGEVVQRICYNCRDDKIREETESASQELKNKLFDDIKAVNEERENKTKEMNKIGSKIKKLEHKYKDNLIRYDTEQEEVRKELEKQKKITADLEALYKEIKMQLEVAQISEGKADIRFKRVNQALQTLKIEDQTLESENLDQKNTLEDLKASAQHKVPIKLVKDSLCKFCLMKVSLTHTVMFKNVLPIADDKKASTQNYEDIKRNTCSCNIH